MYLSKLTIEGFKSFGEKISINFCKGLTVIVGPNGSGKSNILDAIKWVFGCRSLKEIRIDEVKNILFHGTNKNARFAEVSATLSDENGCNDDITICRRLYQDGTFEYYLNGQQVRLKDVKEFVAKNSSAFTDYSLFEQNNVDSIIKITPKERGKFFEDVAGLSYYRLKYDETLKTLQKINEKFSPLEKKIKEKEKEKELLEVEAEQTRDYLKTVEELKNTKKKMMVVNYKKIAHEADKYQIELNEIEKETCALYTSLINTMITSNQLKETLHDIKNAQETASNQMTIYLEARDKIYEELQKKQRDFQNLQEESNKIIASYDLLKKETFELTQKISSLTTEKTQLEVNLMSINQYLVGLEEIQRNLIENKTNLQSQVKDLEGKLLENNWELSNINNELSRLEKETKLESENQNQMLKKIREKNNIKEVSINSLEKLKKEIENLNKMLDSEKNSFKILEAEMKAIQEEKIKKQATLQILSEELDKLKNEQCSMREVIENEVKELKQYLAQLNQDKSQYVLLFDVLQFEENTPEQLLKFIGIFENAILCSKEAPLLAELTPPVNVFFIFPKNLTHDEQISFLSFLHQNHLICKNEMYIENLYAVFSYYMNNSSGLFPLNENIHIKLGTSTPEITNLYYLTAKVGEKITSLKNRIEEENVLLTDYENKIKNIEKELAQKRTTVYEINVEIDNKTKEYNNISKEVEVLTNEIEYLNTSINLIDRKIDNLLENKQNLLLRKKNIEELIANIKNRYEQNITLLEDIEKEFQTITGQIEELKARQNNESNKIKNLENNLVEYKNKLYRIGNQLEEIEKKKTDNEKATQQFETSIQNLGRRLEMNNQLYHFWGKFKDSLCEIEKHNLEQYKTLAGEIEKIRNSYSQKKNSIYQICLKLGMLTEKMDEIKRVCLEELGQQYELIEQNYQGIEEDIDTLKQTIKQYDNKIANFKNINMNAIDKLNALNEELEVYRSEYNKLFVIHRELIEFLDNLEKEASSIFENTISTLSDSFNKYIRKMFEGGRGRLQLSKNGIDYEVNLDVQIPNKNIKNLDSFSGGERALISLALLFSLLELKPSPFYVLDEIDASLDDNNLSKLLGLLKEFSYNHQILMITHNKHTLNIADYIIGVTIGQESFTRVLGISWEKALSYAN